MPEQDLVRALCAGRPGSEEEFVGRYRPLALGIAAGRFALSPEDAEDVFQELLARLWSDDFRALRAWRGEGKLSTYLTVIVTRMCLARRKRSQREAPLDESAEIASAEPEPDTLTTDRERLEAARDALAALRPRDRLLISLRFASERSPAEIAPLLGLSAGACRKAVHDALGRLRREMRDRNPELFRK